MPEQPRDRQIASQSPKHQATLEKKIAGLRADVQSDRLSMSIGELAGLYERSEIDIHPKFQRILRWSDEQKTRLIESILLRIPIPPVFVSQAQDGSWDVVDGVQRLGTIFEFLGILRQEDSSLRPAFKLSGTVLLAELDGYLFDSENAEAKIFSQAMRLDFRRSRLDLHIILKESTPSSKYELFERLNTGGAIASPQEVRNCVLVWMNETLFDWMKNLCEDEHFQNTTPLSERLLDQQFRLELLLRFFVLHNINVDELRGLKDLSEFLNGKNRDLASNKTINRSHLEHTFRTTFRLLDEALGGDVFRKYDVAKTRYAGAFLISSFEAIAMGVAYNIALWEKNPDSKSTIEAKVRSLWSQKAFIDNIGIGISSSARMIHTVPLGRTYFIT
jgi:hypothetical protein